MSSISDLPGYVAVSRRANLLNDPVVLFIAGCKYIRNFHKLVWVSPFIFPEHLVASHLVIYYNSET